MAYSGVYVFGDSLVDPGNALKLAQFYGTLTFSDLPEGAPTLQQGYLQGRFSNGYTFADLLSNKYAGQVTKPVFPFHYEDPWIGVPINPFAGDPSGNNLNFAYGGAQIRQGKEVVPDLDGQTDAFKDAVDNHADANALYIVTMGGNDVRSLAPAGSAPATQATAYATLDAAADKLTTELKQIGLIGVKNVLLTGVPDVGLIPKYDVNSNLVLDVTEAARSAAATDYSRYLDNLFRSKVIPALQDAGLNVTYVPLMDYTDASGTHTGALNAIMPELAVLNGLPSSELTQHLLNHQDLVFFDQVHPNAQTHALVTAYANSLLPGGSWVETPVLLGADVDYRAMGSISAAGEVDKLSIAMVAGTTYTFQMLGVSSLTTFTLRQLGLGPINPSTLLSDTSLQLATASGTVLRTDDDSGMGLDSSLAFSATSAGNHVLSMSAVGSLKGSYVVTATVTGAAMNGGNSYIVNNASTLVLEGHGGLGHDIVLSSVSYALSGGSEIEVLRTTNDRGKGAINLTGNEFAQTLIGNAGSNVLEGKDGADTFYGDKGNDRFVLGRDALTNTSAVDRIMDYAAGDIVDLTQVLNLGAGTNVSGGGYMRITTGGLIQVDLDGGGNGWATLSTINGTGAVTVRYMLGGSASNLSVSRVPDSAVLLSAGMYEADALAASGNHPVLSTDAFGFV
jgi:phospholipase/lecithinase/hemolysin